MKRNKGKKKGAIKLNMSGVEAGGKIYPAGKYPATIEAGERKEGEDSGKEYIEWKFKLTGGKGKGAVVFDNTSLQPQALFRLRGLLEAVGYEFPDEDDFEFDPSDIVGEELVVEVFEDDFEGRTRMKVANYGSPGSDEGTADDDDDEEDDDDKKKKKKDDDEKELPTADEVNEMDEDELKEAIEESGLKVKTKGKLKKDRAAFIAAIEEAAEEEDDDDEEEEEDDKKKSKKSKESNDDDDDDEEGDFKKGDKVTFTDEGKKYKGKIVSIKNDEATVNVNGDDWQVDVSELKAA